MKSSTAALVLGVLSPLALAAPLDVKLSTASDWTAEEWDAIVVGAGPAGIIVADRLSEAGKKTLLLEGGGKSYGVTGGTEKPEWLEGTDLSRVDVPGLYNTIFADRGNLICGNITTFGGCTIGGSSAINAGLYFEPPAADYDWYFPEGWKSKDVDAATARLYARQPQRVVTSKNQKMYNQQGYEAAKDWIVNSAGYKEVDINGAADLKAEVFGHPAFDYNDGQRGGPTTTYLQTALGRSNFHLESGVKVQRVVRDGKKATGVVANVDGAETTIKLADNGRVVLSGGAIYSPQILMYSAIGDPEVLSRLAAGGILGDVTPSEWINNTAVGDGLFDNPNTFIELEDEKVPAYTYQYDEPVKSDVELYLKERSGPLAFAGQTSVFWTYMNHTDGTSTGVQGTINTFGYQDYTNKNTISLNVYGTSGLLSKGKVNIDENFLPAPSDDVYYSDAENRDAEDIAQFIYNLFQKLPATGLKPLNLPANSTKDEIKTYITKPSAYAAGMVNHWSSSCRFGSCVDTNAQVIGTDNIHVVDGSIVAPLTVNPQFGIMVAAERASELILKL
ncbi:GMC oxidoreductase [Aplosporella prunicola CBS 121167]|uniref:GMC oxidoreductase n=1 Tax=Aplosporella prunicola CBS 121167 TaxID=1176127 RepID=A0A6A6B5Y5_9PEZI|nr:GMC oxidoreductase [Aplosporella prunicola CBS 121167]KAF2139038.1 GMC oxidoreductase [Aplosporella prunicola CBS 121167]